MPTVHIIGAGLAGLASAVQLASSSHRIVLHDAAPRAGGRCRSFLDDQLGCVVDNGNHLLLSANHAAHSFLEKVGAAHTLVGPVGSRFPFLDLRTRHQWTLHPNDGPVPWWLFSPARRIPGTNPLHYLSALRLLAAGPRATVADCIRTTDPLFRPFWEPLTLAVMNMATDRAAAAPLRNVLLRTFARGGAHCRPLVARDGLSASFVDPALAFLRHHGAQLQMSRRLRGLRIGQKKRADALQFVGQLTPLETDDRAIIAVPPTAATELIPNLNPPLEGEPVVNAHFRLPSPSQLPGGAHFLGLLGGTAHWVFVRGEVASTTVSAARELAQRPNEEIAALLWKDLAVVFGLPAEEIPPHRIIKEKRATFTQDPVNIRRRPPVTTSLANVFLAGDWIDTGLPATIESAVASGFAAADALEASLTEQAA